MPMLDGMDEGGVDEVDPVDVVEGAHLCSKDHDTAKPPESSTMLESREMVVFGECDYPESSFNVFAEFLEDNNVNRSGSTAEPTEQPCASPRYMDDADNMVEELMVRDYDSSNLAIVGTSKNRERIQTKLSHWPNISRLKGGSGSGSSYFNNLCADNGKQTASNARYSSFPDVLDNKTSSDDRNEVVGQLKSTGHNQDSNMSSRGGIQTKIMSKSGFSEFFIKSTLKGKGIVFRGPRLDGVRLESRGTNNGKDAASNITGSSPLWGLSADTAMPSSFGLARPGAGGSVHEGVSLREWLKTRQHKINKVECLHIFRQIVDVVDYSHSQGTPLHDLCPSCFKLSQMNQVKYLGPAVQRDMLEDTKVHSIPFPGDHVKRRQPVEQGMFPYSGTYLKKQKFGINMSSARRWPQFTPNYVVESETGNYGDINFVDAQEFRINQHNQSAEFGTRRNLSSHHLANAAQHQLTSISDQLEEKWYMSPEEQNDDICTVSSNIYSLGVLLFELLGHFDSERAHATAMLELRQRILPPHFLSENPKEAGFCLWLLHPEPSSRPTTREILQSEVINGLHEVSAEEQALSIDQDDAKSELLLHFLVSLEEHEQKDAAKLVEEIRLLDADIGEIESRNLSRKHSHHVITDLDMRKFPVQHKVPSSSDLLPDFSFSSNANKMRFMSNINQLESAYFSMRSTIHLPGTDATERQDKDVLRNREHWNLTSETEEQKPADCVGAFFNGLCKYAWYSKFEVRGLLRTGDFSNSANVICSLSFDRDADYFAAAGVSRKIKIFEFDAFFNDLVDIHYPVIEMSNKSRLSCVCWNNYVKNYLASTDYDGVVKLWDMSTGQGVFQYSEHEKRAWSVDFSQVYPTKLASGSDDYSVKLWSINEKNSLDTIRSIANVCCVQFSSHSTHLLAFGSADFRTYCYDLRNVRTPWCVLAGHEKAVSYVKFLDPETLVTASTDNSLKIWNLNKTSSSGLSTAACSLTLGGHTNKKNFVGLSVADGYIACGSETNEVYAYHKSLPMPITSHTFGSIDPISGKETDDDDGLFVSSVCWRGKSDMIIAANSSGCIKVLQMT